MIRTSHRTDLPERIVAIATERLPAHLGAWGRALVAELAAIDGGGQRWRFAAGVLRVALFPPARRPGAVRAAAAIGLVATVLATLASDRLVPGLGVFVATLGLLISGYAIAVAGRSPRWQTGRAHLLSAAVTLTGVLAVIGVVVAVAVTHPAATRDPSHVYSVLLAVTLCGYLLAGVSASVGGGATRAAQWGGIGGALAAIAVWSLLPPMAAAPPISPVLAAASFGAAIVVGAITRSSRGGAQAGLLAAILAGPIHFVMTVMALQLGHPHTLTDPYDIAMYPHSGFPDIASYLLSDELGGRMISLAATPFFMYVIARFGAALAERRSPAQVQ